MLQQRPKRVPWFHEQDTLDLITDIAQTPNLTIISGAGWSIDWGLPSWYDLVELLLTDSVAPEYGIHVSEERARFSSEILSTHDLVGASSIVREALGDRFELSLHAALYKRRRGRFGPGALALAQLFYIWERTGRIQLVTVNYDTSIEDALRYGGLKGRRGGRNVLTIATGADYRKYRNGEFGKAIPVFHLHGALRFDAAVVEGHLIFSEEDYAAVQTRDHWQNRWLKECFADRNGVCCFVGMKLADPNIVHQLFSPSAAISGAMGAQRLAFFPVQGDTHWSNESSVANNIERAIRGRLRKLSIRKVAPDFYTQVPQFFNEVGVCRASSGRSPAAKATKYVDSHRYGIRLQGWRDLMEKTGRIDIRADEPFGTIQRDNHDLLIRARTLLYEIVRDVRGSRHVAERFGLQLWARNPRPDQTTLEMWGSSERVWLERETLLSPPIQHDSPYAAVRAFCGGPTGLEPTRRPGSRWALSLATLIHLSSSGWRRLPVGVIVLESNFREEDSCLVYLDPERRRGISRVLEYIGEFLLTPGVDVQDLNGDMHFAAEEAMVKRIKGLLGNGLRGRRPIFRADGSATFTGQKR